ncbi:hypothetical protein [Methanolobus sp. ZRKC5]|uniref:DUF7266 family protein n=1 Tax=unclassified Methanolobus TaxID=2629569 RepID=UPI00313DC985
MTLRNICSDENAVSVSIGFILTFSITVLMLVMVLSSFYSLMDQAEQTVMRDEFEIHGSDIAVRIASMDTMIGAAENSGSQIGEIRYELSLPSKIAGKTYSLEFVNSTKDIVLTSDDRDETIVKVPYYADNAVVYSTTLYSQKNEYVMTYEPDKDAIIIF